MRNLLFCLMALLLTSCFTVGPEYVRPGGDIPEKWNVEYEAVIDLANVQWWQQFGDPVLDELIITAMRGNLDLRLAAARVDQYLGVLETSRSRYFPQIEAGGSGRRDGTAGQSAERYQAAFNSSWELDLWGRIRRSSEAARARIAGSEAGRRAVVMTVVSSVASNYIVLRGLDQQLEIARETEASYAEGLDLFRIRFHHGAISQLELSQLESQYESARQAVPRYESLIRQQENLLSLLLGRPPGTIPRGKALDQLTGPGIPAGLPSRLLTRRPDIIQAEQELVAANAGIGVARAEYFPRISLTGALGTASPDLGTLLHSGTGFWSVAGAATGPIVNFGAISGQVKQAEALQQQALFHYQQTVLSSFKEVEDVLIQMVKGREELDARQRQILALEEYALLARLQFDAGSSSYLPVLDAERALFANKLARAQLRYTQLGAHVAVYKAMGGGWITEAGQLERGKE
ncbi:MAG: efflux transporter outer membrane subunit [Desulfoarculaceae bacterium]|nr:efflux transporter outer membrane subunit [Desulfoarculaceae bacterium]